MLKPEDFSYAIELHDVEGIDKCLSSGIHPNDIYKNESWFGHLVSMYTRSPRFSECVKVFVKHGLHWETPALLAVLANDAHWLQRQLHQHARLCFSRYSLPNAYTHMQGVSLMHVCAEFNHTACAEVLLEHGAVIDQFAELDDQGFGGQTPLFHTVNQNQHQSADMLQWLLQHGADPLHFVKGLFWGKNQSWETLIPSVNSISYCMMGRLPQFHRDEITTAKTLQMLFKHAYHQHIDIPNIPNKYLEN